MNIHEEFEKFIEEDNKIEKLTSQIEDLRRAIAESSSVKSKLAENIRLYMHEADVTSLHYKGNVMIKHDGYFILTKKDKCKSLD